MERGGGASHVRKWKESPIPPFSPLSPSSLECLLFHTPPHQTPDGRERGKREKGEKGTWPVSMRIIGGRRAVECTDTYRGGKKGIPFFGYNIGDRRTRRWWRGSRRRGIDLIQATLVRRQRRRRRRLPNVGPRRSSRKHHQCHNNLGFGRQRKGGGGGW